MPRVLGKNTKGDLGRFVEKLREYNKTAPTNNRRGYVFGLDVALLFLPELYLDEGENRVGNTGKIVQGIKEDIRELLKHATDLVPIEINLHCFSKVETLRYENVDYVSLLRIVPELQQMVEEQTRTHQSYPTSIFLGQHYNESLFNGQMKEVAAYLNRITELFNKTGKLGGELE
jgi:hypothetical protein